MEFEFTHCFCCLLKGRGSGYCSVVELKSDELFTCDKIFYCIF